MAWPKGARLSEEHKRRIGETAKRNLPLKRRKRTKQQRRDQPDGSYADRRISPKRWYVKKSERVVAEQDGIKVYGKKPDPIPTIMNGRIRLIGHAPGRGEKNVMVHVRPPVEYV
jgi:hypothetical protein